MEDLRLVLSFVLMVIAVIGIPLYVALVIAIPIWRGLDWLTRRKVGKGPELDSARLR